MNLEGSSNSDKELATSMNCGNSTSELQIVPMDPSWSRLRLKRKGKKTGWRIP
jgi:hypothetical protein